MNILWTIYYTIIGLFTHVFFKGVILYALYCGILYITKVRKEWNIVKCVLEFTLCCYFIVLFNLTGVLQLKISSFSDIHAAPNLVPIVNTMNDFINYGTSVIKQVLSNVLLFVPFAILVSSLVKKREKLFIKIVSMSLMLSGSIEIIQYYCGRFADIDDVIWNVSGSIVGYLIYRLCISIIRNIKSNRVIRKVT